MTKYSKSATHELNRWLWRELLKEFPDYFSPYITAGNPALGLVPIIPSQQVPQFTDIIGGAPFIVYSYIKNGVAERFWMNSEQASYIIYDNNEERLRSIFNFMVELLQRVDWSAQEANDYLKPSKFDFKSISLLSATGPEPYQSEGGRQAAMINVNISYTQDIDQTGRRL